MIIVGSAEIVKSPGTVTMRVRVEVGCCDPLIPMMVIGYVPTVAFVATDIVTAVLADPRAGRVTELLSNLTVTPAGTSRTVRLTDASKPPKDANLTVELPERPGATVSVAGVTSIAKVPENSINSKLAPLRSGTPPEYPYPA